MRGIPITTSQYVKKWLLTATSISDIEMRFGKTSALTSTVTPVFIITFLVEYEKSRGVVREKENSEKH